MFGNRTERTTTKAAAHDVHRETDHFIGRDALAIVGRVRQAGVGQPEHEIHFRRGQGNRRRVDPNVLLPVFLHQSAGIAGVGFQMQHAVGVGVQGFVFADFFIRRQADDGFVAVEFGTRVKGEFVFVGAFAARVLVFKPLYVALFDFALVHLGGV